MKLTIVESPGRTLVAVIDDYTGPVPRPGEYIFRPPTRPGGPENVMGVKTVTWGILAYPEGAGHFTGTPEPCVEIHI